MKELAQQIHDMQVETFNNRKRANELELEQRRYVLKLQNAIADEVVDNKRKYSNEAQRRAELDSRLAVSPSYQELDMQIEALRESISLTDIKVEFVKNQLRIALIENSTNVVLEVKK